MLTQHAKAVFNSNFMAAPNNNNNSNNRNTRNRRSPRDGDKNKAAQNQDGGSDLIEKMVTINRCAKVVKGGRRFSFSALLVIGDKQGRVGVGFGKANEVSEAIRKASEKGRKQLKKVSITTGTIPHEVVGEHGGGRVILKPASPGTGIIAGGGVRAVCEAVGIKDILAKSLGSNNHANVVKATIDGLLQLRQREDIFKLRGIAIKPLAANQS